MIERCAVTRLKCRLRCGPRHSARVTWCLVLSTILFTEMGAAQDSRIDSLGIEQLRLRVREAVISAQGADFLHRLMPRVTFTVSFGVRDMLFVDPSSGQASFLPRDVYRLTLAFPLSDLFDGARHRTALLRKEMAMVDLDMERARQEGRRRDQKMRATALQAELASLLEQRELHQKLERYYSILFEEGKVQFDAAANARIRLLEANLRIARLRAELLTIDQE